jgi:hypothetical protein
MIGRSNSAKCGLTSLKLNLWDYGQNKIPKVRTAVVVAILVALHAIHPAAKDRDRTVLTGVTETIPRNVVDVAGTELHAIGDRICRSVGHTPAGVVASAEANLNSRRAHCSRASWRTGGASGERAGVHKANIGEAIEIRAIYRLTNAPHIHGAAIAATPRDGRWFG